MQGIMSLGETEVLSAIAFAGFDERFGDHVI